MLDSVNQTSYPPCGGVYWDSTANLPQRSRAVPKSIGKANMGRNSNLEGFMQGEGIRPQRAEVGREEERRDQEGDIVMLAWCISRRRTRRECFIGSNRSKNHRNSMSTQTRLEVDDQCRNKSSSS